VARAPLHHENEEEEKNHAVSEPDVKGSVISDVVRWTHEAKQRDRVSSVDTSRSYSTSKTDMYVAR